MFIIKDKEGKVICADESQEIVENTLKNLLDCTMEETSEDWQNINGEYRLGGKTIEEQNEEIRQVRENEYQKTSDHLKQDYDESLARGEVDAEEKKQLWLASKDKVRADNPYIDK